MMSVENTLALINMFRSKGVATVKTPAGIVFFGAQRLSNGERKSLMAISQEELKSALKWQKA